MLATFGNFIEAQVVVGGGAWSISGILILVIVIAAAIAITCIILRAMGVALPSWFVQVLWIVAAAVIGVLAIRIIFGI